jgi:anion-transporting  ArsA/GET3 family ATPase
MRARGGDAIVDGSHIVRGFVKELLKKGSIVVLLGPGGVGKTTVAAALGLAAARAGLDTGVITIDPARRLRDALGIERLSSRPSRLDSRRLRAAGLDPSLRLSAMMLDVKRTWDGLVDQFVTTPGGRRRILENPFYRNLTRQFAGAESYAALAQLYDLHAAGRFGLEIVDTPPAAHAFEFLEAPAHLVRLLDSRAARWLFAAHGMAGGGAIGLAGRAARFVVEQLEAFAGAKMLSSVSEFFSAAAEAAGAMSDRFRKTEALLRSSSASFVLVTTPAEDRLREALELVNRMQSERLPLRAIVLNRMLDERAWDALRAAPGRKPAHLAELARLRGSLGREIAADERLRAIVGRLESYSGNQRCEIERAARFARKLPSRVRLMAAPEVEMGVRDLRAIAKVAAVLGGASDARGFLQDAAAAFNIDEARPPARRAAPPAKRP